MRSQEVADAAGITYRQLDNWVRKGWVRADGGDGSGLQRTFTEIEAQVAVTGGALVSIGLRAQQALGYARMLVEGNTDAVEVNGWVIARAGNYVLDGGGAADSEPSFVVDGQTG